MNDIFIGEISWREAPVELLLEADPDRKKVMQYLPHSLVLGVKKSDVILGVCALLEHGEGLFELMNIAVSPSHQRQGYGRKLLQEAIRAMGERKAKRLEVGTGSFGYQLAFYQREGFRVFKVERDFFLNYPEPIYELGIQLKDMLRLAIDF